MSSEADFIELVVKLNKKERKALMTLIRRRDDHTRSANALTTKIQELYKQLTEKYTLVPKSEPRVKPHNKPKTRRT